jgi:hypothetical protein
MVWRRVSTETSVRAPLNSKVMQPDKHQPKGARI